MAEPANAYERKKMSLGLVLAVAAMAGLGAALLMQLRAPDADEAGFRRRRKRSAFALAAFVCGLAGVHQVATSGVPVLLPPEVDGSWSAVMIDGRPAPQGYQLAIENGRVRGGRDDCNS